MCEDKGKQRPSVLPQMPCNTSQNTWGNVNSSWKRNILETHVPSTVFFSSLKQLHARTNLGKKNWSWFAWNQCTYILTLQIVKFRKHYFKLNFLIFSISKNFRTFFDFLKLKKLLLLFFSFGHPSIPPKFLFLLLNSQTE